MLLIFEEYVSLGSVSALQKWGWVRVLFLNPQSHPHTLKMVKRNECLYLMLKLPKIYRFISGGLCNYLKKRILMRKILLICMNNACVLKSKSEALDAIKWPELEYNFTFKNVLWFVRSFTLKWFLSFRTW